MDAWADGLNFYLATHPEGEAAGDHALRAVDGAAASPKAASAATSRRINLDAARSLLRHGRP